MSQDTGVDGCQDQVGKLLNRMMSVDCGDGDNYSWLLGNPFNSHNYN